MRKDGMVCESWNLVIGYLSTSVTSSYITMAIGWRRKKNLII